MKMKLVETLRESGVQWPFDGYSSGYSPGDFSEKRIVIFEGTNILNWVIQLPKVSIDAEDFFCLIPPFRGNHREKATFLNFRTEKPMYIYSLWEEFGVILSVERKEWYSQGMKMNDWGENVRELYLSDQVTHMLTAEVFSLERGGKRSVKSEFSFITFLNNEGFPMKTREDSFVVMGGYGTQSIQKYLPNRSLSDIEEILYGEVIAPIFYTLAMCHCKNVVTQDCETVHYKKKKAKKGKPPKPSIQYKVLDIGLGKLHTVNPQKQDKDSEGEMVEHECRGHFKTYTPAKPLFGIPGNHGTFFCPAHKRGKRENGIIKKDYRVSP